jgi:acetyltransferase-like isoleucine patch superfamily enzyme/glycosyltransferase involved in cell wall biosynthesis
MNGEQRPPTPRISAVIVARNAAATIEACLESVRWCDEIVVVDLASTDHTAAIAARYTDRVIPHLPYDHEEPAKEFAFAQATGDWVFHLNPWERCPDTLAAVLRQAAEKNPAVNGFKIPIQTTLLGHRFEHTGIDPQMAEWRFFRPTTVRQSSRLNRSLTLFGVGAVLSSETHDIAIRCALYPTVENLVAEINRLTTIEARQTVDIGGPVNWSNMLAAAAAEFVSRYQIARGHQDGLPGFLFSVAMAAYAFLTTAKVWELQRAAGVSIDEAPPDLDAVIAALRHGASVMGADPAPAAPERPVEEMSWGRLGAGSTVGLPRFIRNPGRVLIGDRVTIGEGASIEVITGENNQHDSLVTVADDTTIGRELTVVAANQVVIGHAVTIGDGVTLRDVDPAPEGEPLEPGWVVIGEGATIGDGATIGPKVRVGLGAAVEPGAVVRKDVPPYTRVAGDPARPVAEYDVARRVWTPIEAEDEVEEPASVSIVIPAEGGAERLRLVYQAVQQAAAEVPSEVILVDLAGDASLAEQLADLPGEVTFIQNESPVSLVRAVNQAATLARGKYLAIVPPDLFPMKGWLAEMVAAAEANAEVAIVAPRILRHDGTTVSAGGWIAPDGAAVINVPRPPRLDLPVLVHFAPEDGCLLRLDLLVAAAGIDEGYQTSRAAFADYGLVMKASGRRVVYLPTAIAIDTLVVEPDERLLEQDRRYFVEKWSSLGTTELSEQAA